MTRVWQITFLLIISVLISSCFESTVKVEHTGGSSATEASLNASGGSESGSFGEGVVGVTQTTLVRINNSGTETATSLTMALQSPSVTFSGGSFPGTGGNCGTSIGAESSCVVQITFLPTILGVLNTSLKVNYTNSSGTQSLNIPISSNVVTPAVLAISDSDTYNFGNTAVGGNTNKTFTISNSGGHSANVTSTTAFASAFKYLGGSYPGTGGTCSNPIAGSSNCTVIITHNPPALGLMASQLELNYNDGATAQSVTRLIDGNGISPGIVTISESDPYSFGSSIIGTSGNTHTFTLANPSSLTANLTTINVNGAYQYIGGSYPGTGGTCAATLGIGANCSINLIHMPATRGTEAGSLSVDYFNQVNTVNATRTLSATALQVATLSLDGGDPYNFGTRVVGVAGTRTFSLSNTGDVAATAISTTALINGFDFAGGTFPGSGGNCTSSLSAGNSCNIVVTHTPGALGAQASNWSLTYHNGLSGGQSVSKGLLGAGGTAAVLSISDANPHDFGNVIISGAANKVFTVNKSGDSDASSIVISGLTSEFKYVGGSYPGTGGNCANPINTSSCTLELEFRPTVAGAKVATVSVNYFDGATSQTISHTLLGNAQNPANITISESDPYTFTNTVVGNTDTHVFVLTNTGDQPATSMSMATFATGYNYTGGSYPGTSGTCGTSLSASGSCTLDLSFAPTSGAIHNSSINMSYHNGAITTSATRTLTGDGLVPATLTLSGSTPINYQKVVTTYSKSMLITVVNSGDVTATVNTGSVTLPSKYTFVGGSYPGTGGSCPISVTAGSNCTMEVQYSPTAVETNAGNLVLNFNNGTNPSTIQNIALTGEGVTPSTLSISESGTYNYGNMAVGGNVNKIFTITKSGGADAGGVFETTFTSDYSYTGGNYPGTSGTCPVTISTSSCTIDMQFNPGSTGTKNDSLTLNYLNGAVMASTTRPVTGNGVTPAAIGISDASIYNYGAIIVSNFGTHSFTVTNSGGFGATNLTTTNFLTTAMAFKGGSYPGTGGNCSTTLASAASCNIVVDFTPSLSQTYTDQIKFDFFSGAANLSSTRDIDGLGVTAASVTISETGTYDFGDIVIGNTISHPFSITNSGDLAATLLTATSSFSDPQFTYTGGSYPGTGGNCGSSLNGGASCTVEIVYTPASLGADDATLNFSYHSGLANQSISVNLHGDSVTTAGLSISGTPTYNFSNAIVGGANVHTFTVTKTGGAPATGVNVNAFGTEYAFVGGSFPGTGGTCSTTITASCTFTLNFAPTSAGIKNDTITLNYHNGSSAQVATRTVTGNGQDAALLSISESDVYNMGVAPVTTSLSHIFTVTNAGDVSATTVGLNSFATDYDYIGGSFPGTGGTCGTTIGAGANCTVAIELTPSAPGTLVHTMTVSYNNGLTNTNISRVMSGVGESLANVTISDANPYDYGAIVTGQSPSHTFTLSNSGQTTASSLAFGVLPASFTYTGGSFPGTGGNCGASLSGGGNCQVAISFTPSFLAAASGTLTITYNNGASGSNVTKDLQGTGTDAAVLTLSESDTFDYGNQTVGLATVHTFTVTKTGGATANTVTASSLGTEYRFAGGSYPGAGGDCGNSISSGSCDVVVEFAPTSSGTKPLALQLNYHDGAVNTSVTRLVTANGQDPALLTISESDTYSFGSITTSLELTHTFTISNTGDVDATSVGITSLTGQYSFKGGSYPGAAGNCGTTITAGGNCLIEVAFNPTVSGTENNTITVDYHNDVTTTNVSRLITATGLAPASLTITGNTAWGTINPSPTVANPTITQIFTVTNAGEVSATVMSEIGLSGGFDFEDGAAYPGTSGTCTTELGPGASCTLVVRFVPATSTLVNSNVNIQYNDGLTSQNAILPISATGKMFGEWDGSGADHQWDTAVWAP